MSNVDAKDKTEALPPTAGLAPRIGGLFVDTVLLFLGWTPVLIFGLLILGDREPDEPPEANSTDLVDLWWMPVLLVCLSAVFATFWRLSWSPGMKIFGLRAVDRATGAKLHVVKAMIRATLTVAFVFSAIMLPSAGFSDRPADGYNALDMALIYSFAAVLGLSLFGYLWALRDKEGRAIQDRITGVLVMRSAKDV